MRRFLIITAFLFVVCLSTIAPAQTLSSTGTCPGIMTFDVTGATPYSRIMYLRAFGTGSYAIPAWAPCGGTVTGLDATATFVAWEEADAFGDCSFTIWVPAWACGTVYAQVIDTLVCSPSNVILIP